MRYIRLMSPRTGRPPAENPRGNNVSIRLTDVEHEAVSEAAARTGTQIGPWMRDAVIKAARLDAKRAAKHRGLPDGIDTGTWTTSPTGH